MTVPALVKATLAMTSAFVATALVAGLPNGDAKDGQGRPRSARSPFLDAFYAPKPAVITKPVTWVSPFGEQQGWLVRENVNERLPALVLIGTPRAKDFFLQSARDLASIDFAVLLVEVDEEPDRVPSRPASATQNNAIRFEHELAQLSSAVRCLRRREDVLADKIGVLGWGKAARLALELSAAQNLQAAVLTDVELPVTLDAPLSIGLKQTAVLIVRGTSESSPSDRELFARLQRSLSAGHIEHHALEFKSAKTGFMESQRSDAFDSRSADRAWFEIYEFLGKHVEDAELKAPLLVSPRADFAQATRPFVSIGDVMRAVNGATGVCGDVAQSLNEGPRAEKDWKLLRGRAAIMADSSVLLLSLKPPRGSASSWRRHATSFHDAATALAAAADRRNIAEARQAFDRLKGNCGRCHSDHR